MSRRCFDRPTGGYLFNCRHHDHDGGFCSYQGEHPCYAEVVTTIMDRTLMRLRGDHIEGEPGGVLEETAAQVMEGLAALSAEETLLHAELRERYGDGSELLQELRESGSPNLADLLEPVFSRLDEHVMYSVIIDHKPNGSRPMFRVGGLGMCPERAAVEGMRLYEFQQGAELACDLNNGDATISVKVKNIKTEKVTIFDVGAESRFWYSVKETTRG